MRRSKAASNSASGWRTTEASRAWENWRPIAAPICATSLAGPSRSSRAISDACRLAGTAGTGGGTAPSVRCASPSPSASSTAFVISSTNRGIPSDRSTICVITFPGRFLFPARLVMIAATSRSPSRLSIRLVTCDWPAHGALNSGRKVTISSAGRVLIRSTVRLSASKLVGSIQCTSSNIISTGCWLVSAANRVAKASSIPCRRCCGVSSNAG